jgi:DNA-binding transcriptional LysR family regulator
VLTLVAAGAGMSVMSQPMTNVKIPGVVYRRVEGITRTFELAVVYRRNESSPVVKAFIDFMRARVRKQAS